MFLFDKSSGSLPEDGRARFQNEVVFPCELELCNLRLESNTGLSSPFLPISRHALNTLTLVL